MDGIRYYDIRHVRGEATHIDIDNSVVESAGTSFFDQAVIRVLGPKGWGVYSLDSFRPTPARVTELLEKAREIAAITGEEVTLGAAPHGVKAGPPIAEDPLQVDLEEKTALLGAIEQAARVPGIVNTRATYIERHEQVRFTDCHGTEQEFGQVRSGFNVLAVASAQGMMQMGYEREHTISGFNLRHREEMGSKAAATAIALLTAKVPKGGSLRAVLDPELAGVFAHEAVGHASEGDLIHEGSSVLKGRIGERIGNDTLTIADDPSLYLFGFEPCDAEGVLPVRTEMISRGVVSAYLHNLETLAAVGNGVAGHARAMPGQVPQVRMSNTFIENGDSSYDEIIAECRDGILLCGSRGGQVDPGRGVFQFNAEYGYMIENGEQAGMVRDVSLSGEILSTLHNIVLIGDDRTMGQGYCGKGGQSVPVSDGAPHVLLIDAVVGGSGSD
jgi:TldD protein